MTRRFRPRAIVAVLAVLLLVLSWPLGTSMTGPIPPAPPAASVLEPGVSAAPPARSAVPLLPEVPTAPAPDGGGTPVEVSLACSNVSNSGVQQAYDPAGNDLYEVWSGCGGVGFARSVDGGTSFQNASTLVDCGTQPSVAVAPNRTVYVAFVSNCSGGPSPYVLSSSDEGVSFSSPVRVLPDGTVGSVSVDRLSVGPNGTLELLWIASTNASLGGSTCPPYVCAPGQSQFAPFMSYSFDGGQHWTANASVPMSDPTADVLSASMVITPGGTTDILLEEFAMPAGPAPLGTGLLFLTSASVGSTNYSPPRLVSGVPVPAPEGAPDGSLGLDASGTLYAAFDSDQTGPDSVYLAWSSGAPGAGWGSTILNRSIAQSSRDLVGVAGGGVGLAHVAWLSNDSTGADWETWGETLWANGSDASGPFAVSSTFGRPAVPIQALPSLADLSGGRTAVAWSFSLAPPPPGTGVNLQVFEANETEPLPGDPGSVDVTSGPGSAFVRWTPPTGEAPVTGYTIGWGHDQPPRTLSVGPTALNATLSPIVPSVRYEIWVRAFDDAGDGPTSTPWVNLTLSAYSIVTGSVDPSDANVTLDGVTEVPVLDGSYRVNTSVGAHLLNVTAGGYRPSIATFQTPWNGTKYENFTLLRDLGNITGVVTPSGASLTWMGAPVPVGAGGTYRITGIAGTVGLLNANESDFHNASQTLTIPADSVLWANLTLLPVYGVLELRVTPSNASVSENGLSVTVNASGGARLTLVPGTYEIRASAVGYSTRTEATAVVAGEVDRLSLNLSIA
ncbi:MAG TPA: fibronectin type III domain-containing protein, partial [Thermoplasmata archaeon]|nr:fibronectin type III domain-containing protein [Thermoplasmata archaeon]